MNLVSPPQQEIDALHALLDAGEYPQVVGRADMLLARFPGAFVLHNIAGTAHGMLGDHPRAVEHFRGALLARPGFAMGHVNLAVALGQLGRAGEAVAALERAVSLEPDNVDALNCLGAMLAHVGRAEEAAGAFRRHLALAPAFIDAHLGLGRALMALGRLNDAATAFWQALQINAYVPEARLGLIACCEATLALEPNHAEARAQKLYHLAHICDWDAIRADAHLIPSLGVTGHAVPPFNLLSLDDSPERNRLRAERYAASRYASPRPAPRPPRQDGRPIRIGYFSAEFHEHAVMQCIAGLFERHDRTRFEVHHFSFGPDKEGAMRRRLKAGADAFHEVRDLSDADIAAFARRQRIDIAVDLMGYTGAHRLGIFAHRAAPVQCAYLGFPGTLGAPFIDYLIADRIVIPQEARPHFVENIIHMPDSFMVADHLAAIDGERTAGRPMTRAEMDLPEQGFVFCSFNNPYKITPDMFDIWMRLLARVEGSVLWLVRTGSLAEDNLREQARRRHVDPDRLVFAPLMSDMGDHMARHALADLFLDSFNYNGHATAGIALAAGLPLITRTGKAFPARVATSLLAAIGLPELITATSEEYERLAFALATDRERMAGIRRKLASNILTEPLFDTARFTRHLERAFERIHQRSLAGEPPGDIAIEAEGR